MQISNTPFFNSSLFFNQTFSFPLTLQKKTISIALLIFGILTALYIATYSLKKRIFILQPKTERDPISQPAAKRLDDLSINILLEKKSHFLQHKADANPTLGQSQKPSSYLNSLSINILESIFSMLTPNEWHALLCSNKLFSEVSKNPSVLSCLTEKGYHFINSYISIGYIPIHKRLEFAKRSGHLLKKLNLMNSYITDQELEDLLNVCKNIKELNVSECERLTEDSIKRLPPNIQVLDLSYSELTQKCLVDLPKSLISLNLSGWDLTASSLSTLPSNLQSLYLQSCPEDFSLSNLPPDLQLLDLSNCVNLTNANTPPLPRNLKILNLSQCSAISEQTLENLPPHLEFLDLSYCQFQKIYDLPIYLRSLNLMNAQFIITTSNRWPLNLTFLNLSGCTVTDTAIQHLPKTLTSLDLSKCLIIKESTVSSKTSGDQCNLPNDPSILFDTTHTVIQTLPRDLKSLKLSECYIKDRTIEYLPSHVESLDLSKCYFLTDKAITALPKTLKSLNLSHCNQLFHLGSFPSGLEILDLSSCNNLNDTAIQNLPKNLHTLFLNDSIEKYETTAIDQLPQTLKVLDLSGGSLELQAISLLPRNLKSLLLNNCYISSHIIKDLPMDLELLNLSGCLDLTEKELNHLPKGLKALMLERCNFSRISSIHFPKSLQYLSLAHSQELEDTILDALPDGLITLKIIGCNKISVPTIKKLIKRNIDVYTDKWIPNKFDSTL